MRKFIFLLLCVCLCSSVLFSCDKKEDNPNPNKLVLDRFYATINPKHKTTIKTGESGVMSYEDSIKFIVKYADEQYVWSEKDRDHYGRGVPGRDTVNNRFFWFGLDAVIKVDELNGEPVYELGQAVADYYNNVYTARYNTTTNEVIHPDSAWGEYWRKDTIAYIPNSVVYKARELISEAFEKKDYERCYKLLDSCYYFIPTTGAKYRALMEKGEN